MQRFLTHLLFISTLVFISACAAPAAAIPTEKIPDVPTSTTVNVAPTATQAPTSTPTSMPSETPVPSPTPSPTPSPEPTLTATPAVVYNAIGLYEMPEHCARKSEFVRSIIYCITSIEVVRDASMVVNITWKSINSNGGCYTEDSNANNRAMYMTDDLGNRYDHEGAGGDLARNIVNTCGGDVNYSGWFYFPPPAAGAKVLTYHDEDQKLEISDLVLENPQVIKGQFVFSHTPYALEFLTATWKLETGADGSPLLTHLLIPVCQVMEQFPAETQGTLKNTIAIGAIEYKIFGFSDKPNNINVRQYLPIKGLVLADPAQQPLVRVNIPLDKSTECLADAGILLAALYASAGK